MRVLVGCEYSGVVRDAFIKRGHDAISCDLLPSESDFGPHIQGDILEILENLSAHSYDRFDLIILHIPCTSVALCGNRWYGKGMPKHRERIDSVVWARKVWQLAIKKSRRAALENPPGVLRTSGVFAHTHPMTLGNKRKTTEPDFQFIQPYQYGHKEQKKTMLALYNLPRLVPTNNVYEEMMKLPKNKRERIFYMSPGKDRGKERARFFTGWADAMADQWGNL